MSGHVITNFEDLTYFIHCTLLMTKSAVDRSLDRVTNLKKVLKNHAYFIKSTNYDGDI